MDTNAGAMGCPDTSSDPLPTVGTLVTTKRAPVKPAARDRSALLPMRLRLDEGDHPNKQLPQTNPLRGGIPSRIAEISGFMAVIDTFLKLMLEKRAERLVLLPDAVPFLLKAV